MKRRKFLKSGLVAGLTPLFVNGYAMNSLSASMIPASACDIDDRVLVIVYLGGANDAINAAVPLNQFGEYRDARPDIHLPQNSLIKLDNSLTGTSQDLGLHPSLTGLKDLYDNSKLSIVQRVGYPQPNRSHFTSQDNMLKGIDGTIANSGVSEGWIGRFLTDKYPTYKGLPFDNHEDPLGIILGDTQSTGFHTAAEHEMEINLSGQDPAGFFNIISSLSGEPISNFPNSENGEMLSYISQVEKSTQVYSERISSVFDTGGMAPQEVYPNSSLANQLKTVARLIVGGSKTKVFMAKKGGWDNHVNAVNASDTRLGKHANLLADLGDSLQSFQNDLVAKGISSQVVTVVFSEFGRKIIQNGNLGTDHGTMSSMFVVGDAVNAGVFGDNIDILNQDNQGAPDPGQLQNDYRTVFANICQDWMGASDDSILNTFPLTPSQVVLTNLGLINSNEKVDNTCYFEPVPPVSLTIRGRLYLEGFLESSGLMSTELADSGVLPTSQPYGDTRYSYYGEESVSSFPANTVDWLLMEVWNESNLVIDRKAVLLRNDGRITKLNGGLQILVSDLYPEKIRIAFLHRSHIGVLASKKIDAAQEATPVVNISTAVDTVEGNNQLKNIGGKYAMIAGDADQNGLINTADYSYWKRSSTNSVAGYQNADLNADGLVDNSDYLLWKNNRSKIGNPILHGILKR